MGSPQEYLSSWANTAARWGRWLSRYSLPLKLTLPVVVSVLVLSVVSAVVIGRLVTRIHETRAARRVGRITATVEDALGRENASIHAAIGPLLKTLCLVADKSILVTDRDGRVGFACDDDLLGTMVDVHGVGTRSPVAHRGERWARWIRSLDGGAACAGCHPSARPIGYLGVDVPTAEAEAEVREQQRLNLVVGAILGAVIAALLVLVQIVFVYRPIQGLTTTVQRIRAGDLSVRSPARGRDEIGRLARSVNEMTASLERAQAELDRTHRAELAHSEKLAALGQLFTSVAHEIKNQLAGIIAALRVLEQGAPASDGNKPVLGKILSQMERMNHTAIAALEFARPLKTAVTSVDVVDLLDRTLFFIERQAAEQHVELRKRYARGMPPARIDEDLMKQVFLNVLLNGLQAMPLGGSLDVETRVAGSNAIEVTISDQGIGIPSEDRERIFSPFFSTKPQGTGLGLYISRQIVETQRGEIVVESHPGRGTSFTIRVPSDNGPEDQRHASG